MKTFIFLILFPFIANADSFSPLEDNGNSKFDRIGNIEGYLKDRNKDNDRVDQALVAQGKIIEDLQKKIDQLVDKQVILVNEQKKKEDVADKTDVNERLSDIENKIIQIQSEQIKKLQDEVKTMDNSIKTLEEIIKTLEKKLNR